MVPPYPKIPISLVDEALLPSNYKILSDGNWAIFGKINLPKVERSRRRLLGLLAALLTVSLSVKHKLSNWNERLIDFVLESTNDFTEEYKNYQIMSYTLLSNTLPRIVIGHNMYKIRVENIVHADPSFTLHEVLREGLRAYSCLMVIRPFFSCVIFKRSNFIYMFIPFACDKMGHQKNGQGPACMMRVVDIGSLVSRIEKSSKRPESGYFVAALHVIDISPHLLEHSLKMNKLQSSNLPQPVKTQRKQNLNSVNGNLHINFLNA